MHTHTALPATALARVGSLVGGDVHIPDSSKFSSVISRG